MAETTRILDSSTHFQVLKLDQPVRPAVFVDAQQVRRRYKELAILVHPDKNRATDAEAAFKRLSEAYECLVNERSQRNYLQQLQVPQRATGFTTAKHKSKYKRKRKTRSEQQPEHVSKRRRRSPEEVWQEFQRQEEELARQQFHAEGFDRFYESTSKRTPEETQTSQNAAASEKQQIILNSNLDAKARKWAMWSKPTSAIARTESKVSTTEPPEAPSSSAARSGNQTDLICCLLCRRKFPTDEALHRHESLSKLHLTNVKAKQAHESSDGP